MNPMRRTVFKAATAALLSPALHRHASAAAGGRPLPIPEAWELGGEGRVALDAIGGWANFLDGARTPVVGFGQPFLGPVLRLRRGTTAHIDVRNRIRDAITVHWHGMHVPGDMDGGPHLAIPPEGGWQAALEVDQPAATLWYHSHAHGRTAEHVYYGLAGMMVVDDPQRDDGSLPSRYGIDDLPLIVQDRAFQADGQFAYSNAGPAIMFGFRGDQILVNGAIRPVARVPRGIARLRLLNASNARIYRFGFEDDRPMWRIASDAGLLPRPVRELRLVLAPGERAELLVDFADGNPVRLLSGFDANRPMGGMMGGMGRMGGFGAEPQAVVDSAFEVMRFTVDETVTATHRSLPERLAAAAPRPDFGEPVRRRRFSLDMHGMMGGGMMGRGMGGGMGSGMGRGMGMSAMGINGRPFDMGRIDERVRRGDTELWEVFAPDMAHPFHVHGASFQVLSLDGRPVDLASTGLKDTVLVQGRAEILVRFEHRADERAPFMFHCHILEHEDAGMMGQFTVS